MKFTPGVVIVLALTAWACQREQPHRFTRLSPEKSGIAFSNEVRETPEWNILTYEYAYNGGGVAAADFNNDGLCDLYFTANMSPNKLYLNKGNLKFEDVTEQAGVTGREKWKTGVSVVDINADGWLDIYVCYSGLDEVPHAKQLFVNTGKLVNGVPTFVDRAAEYGLDSPETFSTQAAFFDYDRDGDLDMFLLNQGNHFYSPFLNTRALRLTRHPQFGNRLYRNNTISATPINGPRFTDVSAEAGIHGGGINFGLGVAVSDVNDDGWPDLYVTNDYEEQDFLYINRHDGSFRETSASSFGHFSRNGMGADIADMNNDGRPDIMEVDMWPPDNYRQKLLKGPDDYNHYHLMVDSGFHFQQMRNTLQLNSGVLPDGTPLFSEIGQLSGVAATDWSWAPLWLDADNDGVKDLFVTNGYLHDFTSLDFLKFTVEDARKEATAKGKALQVHDLISKMSSTKTSDFMFKGNGDLTFSDVTKAWGIEVPNLSFGVTYADLDNDGDLEIITNNTNEPATIWENHSREEKQNQFLRIRLEGSSTNPQAIGAKIFVDTDSVHQSQELYLSRGFQSSVEPVLHFGMLSSSQHARVRVIWPDQRISIIESTELNKTLSVSYTSSKENLPKVETHHSMFTDITSSTGVSMVHRESAFNDFSHEPLLPYQLSRNGTAVAVGDVNGDGEDDFYVGGAAGQAGKLFIATGNGYQEAKQQPWQADAACEDTGAVFFDADEDGDLDLFVVSGSTEFESGSAMLDDRLYINSAGQFQKAAAGTCPADHVNGSCVAAADFDHDGDVDLFVGGRSRPGQFPMSSPSAILRNDRDASGRHVFHVVTTEINSDLRLPGMVTDAVWADLDHDSWMDLIVVGEWMPVRIFMNQKGKLVEQHSDILTASHGLWQRIAATDLDNDGDVDLVLGNAGENLPWRVSEQQPLNLYYGDINADGKIDPIMTMTLDGKQFPVASRDELLLQINSLRKNFTTYSAYGKATFQEVVGPVAAATLTKLDVTTTRTIVLENRGAQGFYRRELPIEVQFSSVRGIIPTDVNGDGKLDLVVAGNYFPYRVQYGPSDASFGTVLMNKGKSYQPMGWSDTGFLAPGDVRNLQLLRGKKSRRLLITRSNGPVQLFEF